MKFNKLLFQTKFGQYGLNSLLAYLELKKAGLNEVVLTYIIPQEDVAFVPYGGFLKKEKKRITEEARIRFEDWQKALAPLGIKSKIRIETGSEPTTILDIAEEEGVDLIVTGRKERTAFEKIYVGSHILDIIRRSEIPVFMGKYMVQFESEGQLLTRTNDNIYQRPLLATDWSEPSENALKALLAFGSACEEILVAHIIGAKRSAGLNDTALKKLEDESEKRLQTYCQMITEAGIKAKSILSAGKTVEEIMKLSRSRGASMIAMGRTGNDWFQEYWIGGVSHKIAELSELPVLLVP